MTQLGILPLYKIDGPSSRYRIFQFIPHLNANGINCTIASAPERRFIERLSYIPRLIPLIISADALFVQKRTLPSFLLTLIRLLKAPMIFDFDDAIEKFMVLQKTEFGC